MRLPLPMFSSSLAAVLIMAAVEVRAGSLEMWTPGQTGISFSIGATMVGQKSTDLNSTPPLAMSSSHVSIATAVPPLRFPGAPVTGLAGLPYFVGGTLSLLTQIGVLPKPQPLSSGAVAGATAANLPPVVNSGATATTAVTTSASTLALASASALSPAYSSSSQQIWASGTSSSSATFHLSGSSSSLMQNLLGSVIGSLFTNATISSPVVVTSGVKISRTDTTISGTGSVSFQAPVIIMGSGSLILAMPTSVDETDPGTAFSESNPVDLITSESGALFPVGTSVRVHGLMGPTAGTGSGVTATITNNSQSAMIIKQTSSGGLSFTRSVNTPPTPGTP